ncbi:MAG: hypothetical protein PVF32_23175 [Desulfobacterales bacterium]
MSKCVSKHSNQTKGPFVFCAGNAAHVDSKQSGEKPQWKKYGRHNRQDIHGLVHLLSLRLFCAVISQNGSNRCGGCTGLSHVFLHLKIHKDS